MFSPCQKQSNECSLGIKIHYGGIQYVVQIIKTKSVGCSQTDKFIFSCINWVNLAHRTFLIQNRPAHPLHTWVEEVFCILCVQFGLARLLVLSVMFLSVRVLTLTKLIKPEHFSMCVMLSKFPLLVCRFFFCNSWHVWKSALHNPQFWLWPKLLLNLL